MEMHRKPLGRIAAGQLGDKSHVVTIAPPPPYEGVGNALRSTYAPQRDALPDDMMHLLAKLDRR
jgi:hypothetical protein